MKKKIAKRKLGTAFKVSELRRLLGGRKSVVCVMKAASSSSLKRWENKECKPIPAHIHLVDKTYAETKLMAKLLLKKLKNEKSFDWTGIEERGVARGLRRNFQGLFWGTAKKQGLKVRDVNSARALKSKKSNRQK